MVRSQFPGHTHTVTTPPTLENSTVLFSPATSAVEVPCAPPGSLPGRRHCIGWESTLQSRKVFEGLRPDCSAGPLRRTAPPDCSARLLPQTAPPHYLVARSLPAGTVCRYRVPCRRAWVCFACSAFRPLMLFMVPEAAVISMWGR